MKTRSRTKTRTILLASLTLAMHAPAADLIVEENGVLPNFSTIQDAVNAASPGDRIFVKNKSGGVPYQENVTIDKPLELLAFASNSNFLVFGNYTINPSAFSFSAVNDTLRIIGMLNTSGSINAASNNSTGTPIRLDLHGNQLNSGSINCTGTGYLSHLSGNWLLSGSITARESTITGNLVNGNITVNDAAGSSIGGDDTLYIVGNRLTTNTGAVTTGRILWSNNDHYFHIANNWVRSDIGNSLAVGLIDINQIRTGAETNQIVNNSCESTDAGYQIGINIGPAIPAGCRLKIENNLFHDEFSGNDNLSFEWAIHFATVSSGALVEVNYNVHEGLEQGLSNGNAALISFTGNQTAPATLDPDNVTGICSTAECINTGHPGSHHTDHDLTRNDVGVAGGSYNLNNFWPILTGGARVYLVKTPRTFAPTAPGSLEASAEANDR